jgi:hypothetical protein
VADPTLSAIDRFFDFIDKGVDAADKVLNRGKHTADQQKVRRAKREVIDTAPVEKTVKKTASAPAASTSTSVVKKPYFYILETVDPKSGDTLYVVTDGGNARTVCSTREFAAQVLRALEKA